MFILIINDRGDSMKHAYQKPMFDVKEFKFSEHIATSGTVPSACYWGGGATWTHATVGCNSVYHPGVEGWIGLNG